MGGRAPEAFSDMARVLKSPRSGGRVDTVRFSDHAGFCACPRQ